ncbi:hypothetical protein Sango_1110400 [Sesamum angolense]|uniref:Uncharacterized protein n=1 Tax=Sesamum angolense TaxID=2727404 RepID=A0AAE1WUR4_9LAMI|nr:hypothetical protein Sango_1110400 [Sesamum angolense]
MTPEDALKPIKALNGVHGVRMLPHSPFTFQEIKQHGDLSQSACGTSSIGSNQWLIAQVHNVFVDDSSLSGKFGSKHSFLTPIHCGLSGDRNVAESVANVLTSLPFIALGIQAPRKNFNCKIYANSLIGVGVASSLYHASRGRLRKYFRWADYTMIATATVCLSRAIRNENSKLLMAASALFLPIQPLMVSAVHTGLMEVTSASTSMGSYTASGLCHSTLHIHGCICKRASEDPDLRMAHNVHKMSSVVGGALFIADDLFPETPFLHAGWHLAAAVGVGTCNKLLE